MPALAPAYLLILLLVALALLLAWNIHLERRLHKLLQGKNGASLEDTIIALGQSVRETDEVNEEIQKHLIKMEERLQRSIQQVKTIRFNPFPDQGGNYSFALGLLDEHGDGVVISTLYSRDKTSAFAKPIKNRGSEFELTSEEKQAVSKHV